MLASVDIGDLASLITGVLTLAVIALTYASVRVARSSADAASRAAQLAEAQLKESHRPILVPLDPQQAEPEPLPPIPDPSTLSGRAKVIAQRDLDREAQGIPRRQPPAPEFVVPLHNIGSGAALNVYGTTNVRDHPRDSHGPFASSPHPGIAAGGTGALAFNGHSTTRKKLLSVAITYTDAAGRRYTTNAKWEYREERFGHTTVKEGDGVRVPIGLQVITEAPPLSRLARLAHRVRHPRGVPPAPGPDGGAPLRPGDIVIGAGTQARVVRAAERPAADPEKQ